MPAPSGPVDPSLPEPAPASGTVAGIAPLPAGDAPPVVLSYGLGVDSTAILLRWLTEPASRDFDLSQLVVVTAMTGDEWPQTGADVEAHVLPQLREHGVRFVQAARSRRHVTVSGDGVVVLDDSTSPQRLHLAGSYRLSDEMREAGTIPQSGGARLCSVHAKGDVLDPVIARLTGGRPYRHAFGFESGELRRARKDAAYDTRTRAGFYPLIDWGWDRARCADYIREITGVVFQRSCCTYCPFALGSKAGRERTLRRYAADVDSAVQALLLEHVALALNPAQGLLAGDRLVDAIRDAGHDHVLAALDNELAAAAHAVYEVRRILRPRRDDPTRLANASRAVRTVTTGPRDCLVDRLAVTAGSAPVRGGDGIWRAWVRRRGESLPTTEHFFVVAPAGVRDKQVDSFDRWWADLHPAAA